MNSLHWPLPPNQAWGVELGDAAAAMTLSEKQREDIRNEDAFLYVAGAINSKDIGYATHQTDFVLRFRREGRGLSHLMTGTGSAFD